MQKQYKKISTLLILYMKANEDLNDFQNKFKNFEDEVMTSIDDIYKKEMKKNRGVQKKMLDLQNLRTLRNILKPHWLH